MACTTILVGKNASYDGSTMIARNDDSGSGHFTAKKFTVFQPQDYPAVYKSVISGVEIPLPGSGLRITAVPNAVEGKGLWAASGVNAANVGMTATETITSNPRVLGADPLVKGGIGEEDIVYLVLPYVRSAREGVRRLGSLLEQYGTYEMNGIAFQDVDEVWWLETIGGHHWMARRVPDDVYVVMPIMSTTRPAAGTCCVISTPIRSPGTARTPTLRRAPTTCPGAWCPRKRSRPRT